MSQLQLQIVPRLVYGAKNFVLHEGVRGLFDELIRSTVHGSFSLTSIIAPRRSGKSHGALYVMDTLGERGFSPHIVEGRDLPEWIERRGSRTCSGVGEIVLIDDADGFLEICRTAGSGPFVQLVESFRREGAALILFFSEDPERSGCDDHVMSRIRAGRRVRFGKPGISDMTPLIASMAAQRGIALTPRKQEFLMRRLPHDVAAIDGYLERASRLAEASGSSFKLPVLSEAIGK